MNKPSIPYMRRPCSNCPFKKTCTKGWLGSTRAKEISESENFVCHKTTYSNTEPLQCAGHMIQTGNQNIFVRFAKMLNIELKLSGRKTVMKKQEFIDHHDK